MYEDVQSALHCGQCNRPFDNQSALKKHGYYCRARTAGIIPRSRSCTYCARAKARCDHRKPTCSRCRTKGNDCYYPSNASLGTSPGIQHNEVSLSERWNIAPLLATDSPNVTNFQGVSSVGDVILDSALVISDLEFANLGAEYLNCEDLDIDFTDFSSPLTNDEVAQSSGSGSSAHSTPLTNQTAQRQQAISPSNTPIHTLPTITIRSFTERPKLKTGTQRIANLMFHTLKSYPRLMLQHNTPPSFIHPRLVSSNVEYSSMEPLFNCISLMHMINSGVQGCRKLFWRNVRQECEHIYEERLKLNKWELLAALQALAIYIVIRLDEGETDNNNFDILLLATMSVLAEQFACVNTKYNTQSMQCNNDDLEVSWKDWIFDESRQRLAVVYRVLNMLVCFDLESKCGLQTDLVLAPLPAKKQLREPCDEFVWKAENDRAHGTQSDFALAATGELVKLDGGQRYCGDAMLSYESLDASTPSRSAANWEEWCLGMDGFGGLVMLTASFIV